MIKKNLLPLLLAIALVGCGTSTSTPSPTETEMVIVDHGDHVHEVPAGQEDTVAHEGEVEVAVIGTENNVPPEKDQSEVAAVVLTSDEANYVKAMDRFYAADEYNIHANYFAKVNDEDYFYSSGYTNTEAIDYYTENHFTSSTDPVTENGHYFVEVGGTVKCAEYDGETQEFKEHANPAEHTWADKVWSTFTPGEETYKDDDIINFAATIPTSSFPNLVGKVNVDTLEASINYDASTGDLQSLVAYIPEFTDSQGNAHKEAYVSVSITYGDQVSASPMGYEDFVGYHVEAITADEADDVLDKALADYKEAPVKSLNFSYGGSDSVCTLAHDVTVEIGPNSARWAETGNKYESIDDMSSGYWAADTHYALIKDGKFMCAQLDTVTLDYYECDGSCEYKLAADFVDAIKIGDFKSSEGKFAYYDGTVDSTAIPYIGKLLDGQTVNCEVVVNAQQGSITSVRLDVPSLSIDGVPYETVYANFGFIGEESTPPVPEGIEEALDINE